MVIIGYTGYKPLFIFVGYFDSHHAQGIGCIFPPHGVYTAPHLRTHQNAFTSHQITSNLSDHRTEQNRVAPSAI